MGFTMLVFTNYPIVTTDGLHPYLRQYNVQAGNGHQQIE